MRLDPVKCTFAKLPKVAHDFFVLLSAKAKTNAEFVFPSLLRNRIGKQLAVLKDRVAASFVSYEFPHIGFRRHGLQTIPPHAGSVGRNTV